MDLGEQFVRCSDIAVTCPRVTFPTIHIYGCKRLQTRIHSIEYITTVWTIDNYHEAHRLKNWPS